VGHPRLSGPPATAVQVELAEFQRQFEKSDLETSFDLLLEAEDLLVTIIGQERYNSLFTGFALVQKALAEAGIAKQQGKGEESLEKRREAEMYLGGLKTRMRGIRFRTELRQD
jgi:hypothetical protein